MRDPSPLSARCFLLFWELDDCVVFWWSGTLLNNVQKQNTTPSLISLSQPRSFARPGAARPCTCASLHASVKKRPLPRRENSAMAAVPTKQESFPLEQHHFTRPSLRFSLTGDTVWRVGEPAEDSAHLTVCLLSLAQHSALSDVICCAGCNGAHFLLDHL